MLNSIVCGNCVDLMRELPDEYIDLTVTSPPYDNLRKYKGYEFDFESVAQQLWRVTKPGGIVVWVVGDAVVDGSETGSSFRQALYFKDIGFKLHDTMIYAKEDYVPLTHKRYEQQFEYMFVLLKNKIKTFNPIKVECKNAGKTNSLSHRKDGDTLIKGTFYGEPVKQNKIKPNIWFYPIGKHKTSKDEIAFQHPAIFPDSLAHDHIISWSNADDIVLDPMCGSGTTCKMAKLLGRNFIGFDISEEYCEIARARLNGV